MAYTFNPVVKPAAWAALIFCVQAAQAAQRVEVENRLSKAASTETLAERAGLAPDELRAARSQRYANGLVVTRHQQFYQGVPVWDAFVVDHGNTERKHGPAVLGSVLHKIAEDLPSARPAFSADDALQQAKSSIQQFSTQGDEAKLFVKTGDDGVARLAYLVSFLVRDGKKLTRPHFFIDANLGTVLEQWDGLTTASATGPGGNLKTGQYLYGTNRPALDVASDCAMNNLNVVTVNLEGAAPETVNNTPYKFTCPNNTYKTINGGYAPLNDVHAHATATYRMYMAYFSFPPVPAPMIARAHVGQSYENAVWTGTSANFGDGATTFYPLVSLDVVAHEFSHGFTASHSGLVYNITQSGGMNEAFSDMAGEAAEYYLNGSNDFLVGQQITKTMPYLRNMGSPTLDGLSLEHAFYYAAQNPHYTSGVYNKAFQKLATTPGWNTRKAFEVMVDANRLYWGPNSRFDDGVCGVQNAASNRGYAVADVTAAFNTVGAYCNFVYQPVVQQLYFAQFGRPADPAGQANFANALQSLGALSYLAGLEYSYTQNSTGIRGLIDSLGSSGESLALYPTAQALVGGVFANVANRAPTASEQTYWVDKLNSGAITRGFASLSIARTLFETGGADKETLRRKSVVALYFTTAVDTSTEIAAYSGSAAAAKARTMLSGVTASTNVATYQATANAALASIVAGN